MKKLTFELKEITVSKTFNQTKIEVTFFDSVEKISNRIIITDYNNSVNVEMSYKGTKKELIGEINSKMLLNDIIGDYKATEFTFRTDYRQFVINELALYASEFNEIMNENCFEETYSFNGVQASRVYESGKRRCRLRITERQNIAIMRGE